MIFSTPMAEIFPDLGITARVYDLFYSGKKELYILPTTHTYSKSSVLEICWLAD
jgi:hypothetical protein